MMLDDLYYETVNSVKAEYKMVKNTTADSSCLTIVLMSGKTIIGNTFPNVGMGYVYSSIPMVAEYIRQDSISKAKAKREYLSWILKELEVLEESAEKVDASKVVKEELKTLEEAIVRLSSDNPVIWNLRLSYD